MRGQRKVDQTVIKQALMAIEAAGSQRELEDLRIKYLGRKGGITERLRAIGELPVSQRSAAGVEANKAKGAIESALAEAEKRVKETALAKASREVIDLTAPVSLAVHDIGHLHPVNQLMTELIQTFWQMGYEVVDGPEVDDDWHVFEALNIPEHHPARDMQDTFYLEDGNLPRTHTSNMQIRYMENNKPPIRIIAPGKVYRNEDEDARHSWMFYQLEGLVVDKGISLADLKGTLLTMLRGILGETTQLRLRPNYFPYTEPSVEMDATCVVCAGKGCKTCSGTGWLELGGAGMVHPQVLRNVGIDPEVYSGFAFGFGPERLALIKYDVPDIREFWRPNLKFLEQF